MKKKTMYMNNNTAVFFKEMLIKWIILFYCGLSKDIFPNSEQIFFWSDIKSDKFAMRSVCLSDIKSLYDVLYILFLCRKSQNSIMLIFRDVHKIFCCGFVNCMKKGSYIFMFCIFLMFICQPLNVMIKYGFD